ncbi:glycosyltransferase family 2 protein [Methylocella tundrae]|uniref:Glycosyltransferase n=1 Tax=Methylocella tundrae TaxID=227605 RepID=A0A4U8Z1P2_METTU|nr:glycosyltransferase family 2 protein [Methylocella tundrae]WPP03182.1 glycosyltransferase [Methylocella tundrae]VFU09174.1 Glycosyltransferase [Methylocella tundrae]
MKRSLKIAVGIATSGRPAILRETLRELSRQSRLPDCVFVCPADRTDYDAAEAVSLPFPVFVAKGPRGLCHQRNAIIDLAHAFDVLVFFDDDFLAFPSYLAELEQCFTAQPEIVAATGHIIADGASGPGLNVAAGLGALASFDDATIERPVTDTYTAYGCNMAVRLAPVYENGLRFDEALPLYAWLEDVDLCRQLKPYGRIVKNARMVGVHLGHKGGRTSGVRYGYSQIANPLYLWRKGTFRFNLALDHMARNFLANSGKMLRPEPWVDRRGRAYGNALALLDLVRGRLHPTRILDLD